MTLITNNKEAGVGHMLVHNCIGHPMAAALTLIGAPQLARKAHYATLPASSREHWAFDEIEYTADRRLFLIDFVCAPLTAGLQAIGLHKISRLWRRLFETPLVHATGACGGWSDEAAMRHTKKQKEYDARISRASALEERAASEPDDDAALRLYQLAEKLRASAEALWSTALTLASGAPK
jgi:hypothetical protein